MQKDFQIGEINITPGTRQTVDLPLSWLPDHTQSKMRIHVVHGKKEGPTLFVSAAIHGDEITGVEIIRRLSGVKELSKLRGTLILIPVVNTYGFVGLSRYLPDRRDLNRCFPGHAEGSMASQLAHTFMNEIVARAQYGIDLHSGAVHRANLPQVRANLSDPAVFKIAKAFGTSITLNATLRDGSLREAAQEVGCTMLLYEAGEALRFDEMSARVGVRGIVNVMRDIGMLTTKKPPNKQQSMIVSNSSHWLRAPMGGIMRTRLKLGESVQKDQEIAYITDPLGEVEKPVLANERGIVIGMTNLPIVNRGDALFHVALVDSVSKAETALDRVEASVENDPLLDDVTYI